ncbi:MAG: TatD family deoxyribonuclease [Chitinophagaceae bacterium]|nr:MAG: TatD family deoxyribonuclease [Chitinophagaceae bacterium]
MYSIDTHAHLYAREFDNDRKEMIERAIAQGVKKIFLPNIDLASVQPMFEMQKQWPEVCYSMLGLHPCSVKEDYKESLELLEKEIDKSMEGKNPKIFAIGETGLDYFWDESFKEEQKLALNKHIEWAKKYKLPLVLHNRNASADLIAEIKSAQDGSLTGIFHCFSGTEEEAREIISLGFILGIGGVVTFKNSKLATELQNIPLNKIVLETDSPYLAPMPFRGKRNESSFIPLIAKKISEAKKLDTSTVIEETTLSALKLFNLSD